MGFPTVPLAVVLAVLVVLVLAAANVATGVLAVVLIFGEAVLVEIATVVELELAKTVLAIAVLELPVALLIMEHDSGGPAFLLASAESLETHAVPLSM